jgi:tetratricopeptide (TPR) repeat protein
MSSSSYLNSEDSDSDKEDKIAQNITISEEERLVIIDRTISLKAEGNSYFSKAEYFEAESKYSEAVLLLKKSNLPADTIILLNRCATYLALRKFVPALNDANKGDYTLIKILDSHFKIKIFFSIIAIEIDSSNWKGYWRKGIALMSLSKRSFRTKQAIESFESCLSCSSFPPEKRNEVLNELNKAKARKEQQDAEVK